MHGLLAAPSRSFNRTVTAGKPRGQRRIPPLPSIGSAAVPAVNNLSGLLPDILLTPGISVARLLGEHRKDLFLMLKLIDQTIEKLQHTTDNEFAVLPLTPAWDDVETEDTYNEQN